MYRLMKRLQRLAGIKLSKQSLLELKRKSPVDENNNNNNNNNHDDGDGENKNSDMKKLKRGNSNGKQSEK